MHLYGRRFWEFALVVTHDIRNFLQYSLLTLLIAPLNMVLLRVALFSLSLVVGKVASPMLLL